MTSKQWIYLVLGLVVAYFVLTYLFPSIHSYILTGFGLGTVAAAAASKKIKDAVEKTEKTQSRIAAKDKKITEAKDGLSKTIEETQLLGITVRMKTKEEIEKLEAEKAKIQSEELSVEDAADYIRTKINESY